MEESSSSTSSTSSWEKMTIDDQKNPAGEANKKTCEEKDDTSEKSLYLNYSSSSDDEDLSANKVQKNTDFESTIGSNIILKTRDKAVVDKEEISTSSVESLIDNEKEREYCEPFPTDRRNDDSEESNLNIEKNTSMILQTTELTLSDSAVKEERETDDHNVSNNMVPEEENIDCITEISQSNTEASSITDIPQINSETSSFHITNIYSVNNNHLNEKIDQLTRNKSKLPKPISSTIDSNDDIDIECIEILSDDENGHIQEQKISDKELLLLDNEDLVYSLIRFPFYKRSLTEKIKILNLPLPRPNLTALVSGTAESRYNATSGRDWLVGSSILNRFFCWHCILFHQTKNTWNLSGCKDSKDIWSKLVRHKNSRFHRASKILFIENTKKLKYIPTDDEKKLNILYNETVNKNRQIFKHLLDSLLFVVYEKRIINFDLIKALVKARLESSPELQNYFLYKPSFVNLSETTLYEILDCVKEEIIIKIDRELSDTSHFSCFIDDLVETTGMNKCAVSVRFVNLKGILQERFMGFYDVKERGRAKSILNLIFRIFDTYSLDTYSNKLISYGCDGASLRTEELRKMFSLMPISLPQVQFMTCTSRSIILIIEQCLAVIPKVRLFFQALRSMLKLFGLLKVFNKSLVLLIMQNIILPHLGSNAVCKSKDLAFIIAHKQVLISLFQEVLNLSTTNSDVIFYTQYCLRRLEDINFILYVYIFKDLFELLENLEKDIKYTFKASHFKVTVKAVKTVENTLENWKNDQKIKRYLNLIKGLPDIPELEEMQKQTDLDEAKESQNSKNETKLDSDSENILNEKEMAIQSILNTSDVLKSNNQDTELKTNRNDQELKENFNFNANDNIADRTSTDQQRDISRKNMHTSDSLAHQSDSDDVFSEDEEPPPKKKPKLDITDIEAKSPDSLRTDEDDVLFKFVDEYCNILNNVILQLRVRFFKFDTLKYLQLIDTSMYSAYSKSFPKDLFDSLWRACGSLITTSSRETLQSECEVFWSSPNIQLHKGNIKQVLRTINDNNAHTILPECYKMLCFLATFPLSHESNTNLGYGKMRRYLANCKPNEVSTSLPWIILENVSLQELKKTKSFYEKVMERFSSKNKIPLKFAPI